MNRSDKGIVEVRTKNGHKVTTAEDTMTVNDELFELGQMGMSALTIKLILSKMSCFNGEPVVFEYPDKGSLEIIYYNCKPNFPLSEVFDEIISHINNTPVNQVSLMTEVLFKKRIRTSNSGSLRKLGEDTGNFSVLNNCLVLAFCIPDMIGRRPLREKYCSQETINSFCHSKAANRGINTFEMEIKHASIANDKRGSSWKSLAKIPEKSKKIARAFRSLCSASSHPRKDQEIIFGGQSENKSTVFTSEGLSMWEFDILDYRQCQKLAIAMGIEYSMTFSTIKESATLYLAENINAPEEKKVTQASSPGGSKRTSQTIDDAHVAAAYNLLTDLFEERIKEGSSNKRSRNLE